MSAPRRSLALAGAAAAVGLAAALLANGTMGALSALTATGAGTFGAGTIHLADNDGGGAVVTLVSAPPGTVATGCLRVIAGGTLDARVRLFGAATGGLAPHLTLAITRGTQDVPAFPSCAGFSPDPVDYIGAGAGVVYSGPLSAYPADAASALLDPPSGPVEVWSPGEAHTYRIAVTLGGAEAAQGLNGSATFSWQGRSG